MKSSTDSAFPRRGEIWLVDFSPARGSEQAGQRPALILQNDVGNRHAATTIVASVTTTIRLCPVTTLLPAKSCGLPRESMVNLAQLLTIDRTRLIRKVGALDPAMLKSVDQALRVSLALD